ncbi:MAG: inositol monophosphatase [Planctomycetota bacterium]
MSDASPELLDDLLAFARDVARGAGRLALDRLEGGARVEFKGRRELVTEVDRACEDYVVARIRQAHPEHGYFAEEGHVQPGDWRWIVDPIDGTTNFSQRLPLFSVSLGLEHRGELVLGVVEAPCLAETFWGRRGGGAWCQRGAAPPRRMRTSATAALEDAVLATGFAYVRNESPNTNLDNWAKLAMRARGVRRMGSAAIDLAYVADGRFDAFWEMHLKPYDVAAGVVLIREAGGRVSDFFGGEDWLEGQSIVATNGPLHEALRTELAPVHPDGHVRLP